MDKLSLPFASPIEEAETHKQYRPPTVSLFKLNSDKKSSLLPSNENNRKLPSSLLKLAHDKKLKSRQQSSSPSSKEENDLQNDETHLPKSTPLSAYFLLASAVISLSFIAPLLDLQEGDPIMKIVWRQAATVTLLAVLLLLLATSSSCTTSRTTEGSSSCTGIGCAPPPSAKSWGYAILAGIFYSPCCTTFSVSLNYTTVEDAVAFSNAQSLLILVGKAVLGYTVSLRQSMGALIAFGGVVFCNLDSDQMMMMEEFSSSSATLNGDGTSASIEELDSRVLYGDMLSFACAFFGVAYLMLSKEARTEISMYPFVFVVMLTATVVSILTAVAMGNPSKSGVWTKIGVPLDSFIRIVLTDFRWKSSL